MAQVTYHGETFPVPDGDTALLDYYRGEGAEVVVGEQAAAARFPMVRQPGDDAPHPVEVEQLPEGQAVVVDTSVEQEHPGTGEPMQGVEAPADGTPVELSNPPRPQPGPGDDPAA